MTLKDKAADQLRKVLRKNIEDEQLSLEEIEDTVLLIDELEDGSSESMEFAPDVSGIGAETKFEEGDVVEDESPPSFVVKAGIPNQLEVVEVTDSKAQDVVVSPAHENPENQPRTVADCNPGYPEDDLVIKVSPVDRDGLYSYPQGRLSIKQEEDLEA